jgi:hypothetical protein
MIIAMYRRRKILNKTGLWKFSGVFEFTPFRDQDLPRGLYATVLYDRKLKTPQPNKYISRTLSVLSLPPGLS